MTCRFGKALSDRPEQFYHFLARIAKATLAEIQVCLSLVSRIHSRARRGGIATQVCSRILVMLFDVRALVLAFLSLPAP